MLEPPRLAAWVKDACASRRVAGEELSLEEKARRIASLYEQMRPAAVFVDGGGMGAGVVDRLRQLKVPVIDVQFGAKATTAMLGNDAMPCANMRASCWLAMKQWLSNGSIPDDADLRSELTSPSYSYVLRSGREALLLEAKADMERRGLCSPDLADALSLTFAQPILVHDDPLWHERQRSKVVSEYDPYSSERMDDAPVRMKHIWDGREVVSTPILEHDWNPYEDRD